MDKKNNEQQGPENQDWLEEILEDVNLDGDADMQVAASQESAENLSVDDVIPQEDFDPEHLLPDDWSLDAPADKSSVHGTLGEMEDEAQAQEEQEAQEQARKGRPKHKKGYGLLGIPHILATVVWLALIVAIGVSLGRIIWVCTADLMALGKGDHEVSITIMNEDDLDSVAQKLADAELVRYPGLFKTFAKVTGKEDRISTGTFKLNSRLDYNAMINAMGSYAPAREEVEVAIPEGYNSAQLYKLLEDNKVCTVAELEQYAASGELDDYWFLEGVERGSKYSLEGYLAPDTYKFYTNDQPKRVLEKMLDEFEDRFTDRLKEKFEVLKERYAKNLASHGKDSSYIEEHPLTLNGIVTLASIIDRETSGGEESFEIASVFFNRMCNPDNFPHLESKATVRYAIGDYFSEVPKFSEEDYASTSPYNTFTCEGLPVGPICNPGANSLYAALDPNDTNYYYYVYDKKEQEHLFASSSSGHQQNIAKVESHAAEN